MTADNFHVIDSNVYSFDEPHWAALHFLNRRLAHRQSGSV